MRFDSLRSTRGARVVAASVLVALMVACGRTPPGPIGRVTVPPGVPFRVAADSLASEGFIRWPKFFRIYAKLRGRDRDIQPGTYQLQYGMGYDELLHALRQGVGLERRVTIPEGYSLREIVPLLAQALGMPEDSVQAAVRDSALRAELGVQTETLEGYLFPDTYKFDPGTPVTTIVQAMVANFRRHWGEELAFITTGLSPHETVTLASIVETEAQRPQERPIVASVYVNRVRKHMLLGADPTVIYALKLANRWNGRLTNSDLEIDSPYNTYKVAGLPPTPIAAPGEKAIEAALNPAEGSWLYFVTTNPDTGETKFATSYSEHLKNKREFDQWCAQSDSC